MEGFLNFLADNYIWFASASVFFALALVGIIYESKKKKGQESTTASATVQPISVQPADQPKGEVFIHQQQTPPPAEDPLSNITVAPTLEGLDSHNDNFDTKMNELTSQPEQTLVIEDKPLTAAPAAMPTPDPIPGVDAVAPASDEPTLVISDNSGQGPAA